MGSARERTCPADACARVHELSFMRLSRVFLASMHARTPTNKAAITAANVGGWRGPGHARPAHTGVNYAPREMSNCSPYRKIYNSSRCGKHYVLSHSPTTDPHRLRSFPLRSPIGPLAPSQDTRFTSGSHPYRTAARNEKLEIRWSNVSRDFYSLFLSFSFFSFFFFFASLEIISRWCDEIAFVSWCFVLLANR